MIIHIHIFYNNIVYTGDYVLKIAAIQLNANFADVPSNLMKSEHYIRKAASLGAELIVLPEFFSSAAGFSDQMLNVAMQNRITKTWMKQLSSECQVIIGGSYIDFDGENAYNKFTLVFPSGEIFEHKKDIPTQFENCYYTNGDENNVLVTPIGNLGVALCWEMIRYDTLKRISGRVDLILAGSCWWDIPIDAPRDKDSLRQYNQSLACETPLTFSKLAGVPIVHANHCGRITAYNFPDKNKLQTRQLVGATQIIDKQGHPLAKKHFFEGEGIVISDLTWDTSERQKIRKFPSSYWIPKLPDPYIHAWDTINPKAKLYYETVVLPHYKAVKTNPN